MINNKEYFKTNDVSNINPKDVLTDMMMDESKLVLDKATTFIGTGTESIKITENFINNEDLQLIRQLCDLYYKEIKMNNSDVKKALDLILKYKDLIKNKAESLFGIVLEHDDLANDLNLKSQYLNGRKPYFATNIHTDVLTDKENNVRYSWSGHISNLLYLNDDYNGGELYFAYHNIKIKPKAGMLVSFPGNWYNRHGIMPADDFRYAINIFLKISNFPDQPIYIS